MASDTERTEIERLRAENEALRRERDEGRRREAAVAAVHALINRHPGEAQPVLDAITKHVARLCDAVLVQLYLRDGDALTYGAFYHADRPAYER